MGYRLIKQTFPWFDPSLIIDTDKYRDLRGNSNHKAPIMQQLGPANQRAPEFSH
jgi:hypothetical protein